jgi:hypothetical protein
MRRPKQAGFVLAAMVLAAGAMARPRPPFSLGAYVGNPNGGDPDAEAQFEADFASLSAVLGARPGRLLNYVDYRQTIENWPSNAGWQAWSDRQSAVASVMMPVVGVPMATISAGAPSPDAQFQAFAAGTYDSDIAQIVSAYGQQGFDHVVFRLGWEMNLQGPAYAGDDAQSQADWVAAFRHLYSVIHRAAAQTKMHVSVVWNPGATNYSNAEAINSLYPGDAFVDAVGVDMYADMYPYSDYAYPAYYDWDTGAEDGTVASFIADPVNRAHYWNYPAATKWSLDGSGGHSQSFASILNFALQHHKLFIVPECGAGNASGGHDVLDDPDFPQWLSGQLQAGRAAGLKLGFVGIWDSNGGGNYEFSYASDGKPQEAASWGQYFGAP